MNIVQIEDFFHPDAGYQINILSEYMSKQGYDVTIITSQLDNIPNYLTNFFGKENINEKDKDYENRTGVKIIRVPIYKFISGRAIYKASIFKLVDELSPDILFLHGNDTYIGIRYAFKLREIRYPVIFDNHMLDMASNNKFNKLFHLAYRIFVTPNLINNKSIIIRTVDDDYIFRRYHIPKAQGPIVGFGSNLFIFHPDDVVKKNMRNKLGINPNSVIFIYAGKLDENKGGKFFAQSIAKKICSDKEIVFLVVGNCVGNYGAEVKQIFEKSQNRIIQISTQKYIDLANYFQCADFAVFPKQCSLSFYDVQACGLPVILENNSIGKERTMHNNGVCFEQMNMDDFREKITEFANMDTEHYNEMRQNSMKFIENNYDYAEKSAEYIQLINQAISNFKNINV